ncbi:MAG: hypothetical protein JXB30_16870 [Anaerolineae bacterium]|nr:hypothetical protein [Anaerolineae bacterium]
MASLLQHADVVQFDIRALVASFSPDAGSAMQPGILLPAGAQMGSTDEKEAMKTADETMHPDCTIRMASMDDVESLFALVAQFATS